MEDSFQLQCEYVLFLYIIIDCLSRKKEDCSMYALRTYVIYLNEDCSMYTLRTYVMYLTPGFDSWVRRN